jgi:hypothetical protein
MLRAFFHLLRQTRVHFFVIPAIGAALGAYFTSGILHTALIVLAVLLGALVIWDVFVAAFLTILAWGLRNPGRPASSPKGASPRRSLTVA